MEIVTTAVSYVNGCAHLSLKTGKFPGEPGVLSQLWRPGNAVSDIGEGSSSSSDRMNQLSIKREDQLNERPVIFLLPCPSLSGLQQKVPWTLEVALLTSINTPAVEDLYADDSNLCQCDIKPTITADVKSHSCGPITWGVSIQRAARSFS